MTYPKSLVHPSYKPGVATPIMRFNPETGQPVVDHYQGSPDRYPPVSVNNEDQEARHRAMGYVEFGEQIKMTAYSEYPLMMVHPEHLDAVADVTHAKRDENNNLMQWVEKGHPEKYPHATANSLAEEEKWRAKGYERPGKADARAVEAAKASPHVPGQSVEEWPKMIDGVTVDPRPKPVGFQEYPKFVQGQVVNSLAEERELLGWMNETVEEPACIVEKIELRVVDAAEHEKALQEIAALRAQLAAPPVTSPAEEKRKAARDRMAKARAARKDKAPQSEAAD